MEEREKRMKVNNHVLAIIQVFETFIDIDTDVLLQEIKKSDEKMNNDINHSFFLFDHDGTSNLFLLLRISA